MSPIIEIASEIFEKLVPRKEVIFSKVSGNRDSKKVENVQEISL